MKRRLIVFLFVLASVTGLSAAHGYANCSTDSGSPLDQQNIHVVDSVVWRLRVTKTPAEIDPSATEEERSAALIKKIFDLMKQGEASKKAGHLLTQDDLGTIGEFLHRNRISRNEILQARSRLGVDERFTADQFAEAQRFLSDFSYVRGRMDEYEVNQGMRCHFAWGERMWKDLNNPDSAHALREYGIKTLSEGRAVIGDCWDRDLP